MQFSCPHCHTPYRVSRERLANRILKVRCKVCQNVLAVRDPQLKAVDRTAAYVGIGMGGTADPHALAAATAAQIHQHWYYAQDGDRHGPIPLDQLREAIALGKITGRAYVWCPAFESWVHAAEVEILHVDLERARLRSTAVSAPESTVDSAGAPVSGGLPPSRSGRFRTNPAMQAMAAVRTPAIRSDRLIRSDAEDEVGRSSEGPFGGAISDDDDDDIDFTLPSEPTEIVDRELHRQLLRETELPADGWSPEIPRGGMGGLLDALEAGRAVESPGSDWVQPPPADVASHVVAHHPEESGFSGEHQPAEIDLGDLWGEDDSFGLPPELAGLGVSEAPAPPLQSGANLSDEDSGDVHLSGEDAAYLSDDDSGEPGADRSVSSELEGPEAGPGVPQNSTDAKEGPDDLEDGLDPGAGNVDGRLQEFGFAEGANIGAEVSDDTFEPDDDTGGGNDFENNDGSTVSPALATPVSLTPGDLESLDFGGDSVESEDFERLSAEPDENSINTTDAELNLSDVLESEGGVSDAGVVAEGSRVETTVDEREFGADSDAESADYTVMDTHVPKDWLQRDEDTVGAGSSSVDADGSSLVDDGETLGDAVSSGRNGVIVARSRDQEDVPDLLDTTAVREFDAVFGKHRDEDDFVVKLAREADVTGLKQGRVTVKADGGDTFADDLPIGDTTALVTSDEEHAFFADGKLAEEHSHTGSGVTEPGAAEVRESKQLLKNLQAELSAEEPAPVGPRLHAHEDSTVRRLELAKKRRIAIIVAVTLLLVGLVTLWLAQRSSQTNPDKTDADTEKRADMVPIHRPVYDIPKKENVAVVTDENDQLQEPEADEQEPVLALEPIELDEGTEQQGKGGARKGPQKTAGSADNGGKRGQLNDPKTTSKLDAAQLAALTHDRAEVVLSGSGPRANKEAELAVVVDDRLIGEMFNKRSREMTRCAEKSRVVGKLMISFRVTTGGDVENIQVSSPDAPLPKEASQCVKDVIVRWKFPEQKKPFQFGRVLMISP